MRNLLIGAAAIAVAAGLFFALRPDDEDSSANPPATTTATTATTQTTVTEPPPPALPPPNPPPAQVQIDVRGGIPQGGVRRVTVAKGRRVILLVTADAPDHVHLHGYDLMQDVGPGQPARISFRATIVGTVEAELEDSGVQIAAITAKP
jgi:hypothetical protein